MDVFREKDAAEQAIDYAAAVHGTLQLVPVSDAAEALADDDAGMIGDGLFFAEPPSFAALLLACTAIEQRANQV
jgi:hypothetical protein